MSHIPFAPTWKTDPAESVIDFAIQRNPPGVMEVNNGSAGHVFMELHKSPKKLRIPNGEGWTDVSLEDGSVTHEGDTTSDVEAARNFWKAVTLMFQRAPSAFFAS